MIKLLIEAIIVGVLTVIIGSIVGFIFSKINNKLQPELEYSKKNNNWNKYYVMEQSLFFTGALIHLLCEYLGINTWYCKNGYTVTSL